jgi:citrate synthase
MSFPWTVGNVVFMMGRSPGLIAHGCEGLTCEKPFSHKMKILYTGEEERDLPARFRRK